MVGRERNLRGADQVVVVLLQVVHVLRGLAEEAGALHGARADQRGGQHRDEAGLGGLGDRRVDEGELQERADARQVVEPRAGDLGPALHVDGAERLAELQVVLGLEALGTEVADGAVRLQDDEVLLAADRHVLVDDVAELEEQPLGLGVGLVLGGVGRLDAGLELIGLLEELGALLGEALGISLPSCFCSERSSSKRTPDDLRSSSAESRASTSATSSPRARWEARTRSGSSRSRRRSITPPGYRCVDLALEPILPSVSL